MVQECYKYMDAEADLTNKLRLIDTLRTVTAGKVCSVCVCVFLYAFKIVFNTNSTLVLKMYVDYTRSSKYIKVIASLSG